MPPAKTTTQSVVRTPFFRPSLLLALMGAAIGIINYLKLAPVDNPTTWMYVGSGVFVVFFLVWLLTLGPRMPSGKK